MTTHYVVVNRHRVRANKRSGAADPVFRISRGKHGKPFYRYSVNVHDARLVYDPEHPLPCGATVWLECSECPE